MKDGRFSKTAEQVALARAYATLDPPEDRVCDDPIAISYLSLPLRASVQSLRFGPARRVARRLIQLSPFAGTTLYVPARVSFIDQALLRRVGQGLDQLVLLGAGFDSRAERFAGDLHGVDVFELDFPATQARKLSLRPGARGVKYLAIDLAKEPFGPALLAAGFDPKKRSAFIWEGVIYYLTRGQGGEVLDSIRALLQPGGGLMLDYVIDPPSLSFPYGPLVEASLLLFRAVGEPILSRLAPHEVVPLFERHGFSVADRAESEELQRRYFRGRNADVRILPIWGCLDLTAR
jgi:methyltransferase (TIGR00027 family)